MAEAKKRGRPPGSKNKTSAKLLGQAKTTSAAA
jgi:hypothetical protein